MPLALSDCVLFISLMQSVNGAQVLNTAELFCNEFFWGFRRTSNYEYSIWIVSHLLDLCLLHMHIFLSNQLIVFFYHNLSLK